MADPKAPRSLTPEEQKRRRKRSLALALTLGGLGMLALAVQVYRLRQGEPAMRVAQQLFGFSILYLFLLFATLLAEHGFGFFRPVFG